MESLIEHRRSMEGPSSPVPGDLLRLSGQVHPKRAFRLLGPLITWMGRRQERRIWTSLNHRLVYTAARPVTRPTP